MIPEEFVTFETAKLLKEAGFPQVDEYGIGEGFSYANGELINSIIRLECGYDDMMAAPTQAQAMRWLRETKGIVINIGFWIDRDDDGRQIDGCWKVDFREAPSANPIRRIVDIFLYSTIDYPDTYEAAAEAGIQAACKYLIEKGGDK